MCGIAAVVARDPADLGVISRMVASLWHRGPDDGGDARFPEEGVALGMRRLSIVDLHDGGQPMYDQTRTVAVVFNGEIYNAPELRAQLESRGRRFSTDHSDTEVLVHGFLEWGADLPRRLNGMFAFAVWTRGSNEVFVARDRVGEKPLYVGVYHGGALIGSELKALHASELLDRTLDPVALEQYFALDYVVSPRTVFRDVSQLPAGHRGYVSAAGLRSEPYWRPEFAEADATENALLEEFDALLGQSVRRRLVADVPVGLFLSGGLDSSAVGWYMTRATAPVSSFSIGFDESTHDERIHAKRAADALGTDHREKVFSEDLLLELVTRLPTVLDQPMGDQSILPTLLLSEFTREHVRVALGGDGSDELLMGYRAFRPLRATWALDRWASPLRRPIAATARSLPVYARGHHLRGVRLARRVDEPDVNRLIAHLGSFKGDARGLFQAGIRDELPHRPLDVAAGEMLKGVVGAKTAPQRAVAAYLRGYLQEDILVKVDRASMASSLEVRSPFLDPDLVDFLLRLPTELKMRRLTGKVLLRRLMRGRLPASTLQRPKQGFAVPLSAWLRGPLLPLAREVLGGGGGLADDLLDGAVVRSILDTHTSGRADYGHQLWLLLQLELWNDYWHRRPQDSRSAVAG